MQQGQDDYLIFQKHENGSTGMVWQLARSQSYKKPMVYCEKLCEKTGLHYKNKADLAHRTHMVLRR